MTTPAPTPPVPVYPVTVFPLDAFINPFLVCAVCSKPVQWHTGDGITNHPCGHKGVYTTCNSWSPATGCTCSRWPIVAHPGPSAGGRPAPTPAAATAAAAVKP